MKKKSNRTNPAKSGHSTRAAMSPLLRALTYSRAAREPMTNAALLQCYAALDAFRRGYGSQPLFMALCRHLLIAEELGQLGHAPESGDDIAAAYEALVDLEEQHTATSLWTLDDTAHATLCEALAIYAGQLEHASLEHLAQAEARMVTQSLVAASTRHQAEREELASTES